MLGRLKVPMGSGEKTTKAAERVEGAERAEGAEGAGWTEKAFILTGLGGRCEAGWLRGERGVRTQTGVSEARGGRAGE
jgi:hypothetical protein